MNIQFLATCKKNNSNKIQTHLTLLNSLFPYLNSSEDLHVVGNSQESPIVYISRKIILRALLAQSGIALKALISDVVLT